jgi:hypothetical protein
MLSCWGRRGASLQSGVKPTKDLAAALKIFTSKRSEKLREGYQPIDVSLYGILSTLTSLHPAIAASATIADVATIDGGADVSDLAEASTVEASAFTTLPMRLASSVSVVPLNAPRVIVSHVTPISDTQLAACMDDPAYGVTEKVDGTRCVLEYDDNSKALRAYNRRGQEQPAVPDAAPSLIQLGCPFLIDSERMEGGKAGEYVMFDLLEWQGEDVRSWPYSRRIATLENALRDANLIGWGGATVARAGQVVPGLTLLVPAVTPEDKAQVLAEVQSAGGEGIIVRALHGPSVTGNTRYELKYKLLAEIDAFVIGIKPGLATGSARLALVRPSDGAILEVGNVRSGLRDKDIAELREMLARGEQPVLSVSFLKARTVGITLVEPTTSISSLRTDKLASECTTDQLVEVLGNSRVAMIASATPAIPEAMGAMKAGSGLGVRAA